MIPQLNKIPSYFADMIWWYEY